VLFCSKSKGAAMIGTRRLILISFVLNVLQVTINCENIADTDTARVVISQRADRKSGITKRTILIGNKVCGKHGFIEQGRVTASITVKRQDIDLDSLHKDLHPERAKDEVLIPEKVITDNENVPAVVVSKTDKEKGWFARLNRCCIDHENCDNFIAAKSEQYGFKNDKDYTIYDCKCDDSFAECLKYADSHTADAVGDLYFNVLKMPCIDFGSTGNTTVIDVKLKEKVDKLVEERLKEKEAEREKEAKIEKETEIGNEVRNKKEKENEEKESTTVVRKQHLDPSERRARHFMAGSH